MAPGRELANRLYYRESFFCTFQLVAMNIVHPRATSRMMSRLYLYREQSEDSNLFRVRTGQERTERFHNCMLVDYSMIVSHAKRSPLLQLFLAYCWVRSRVDGVREPSQDVFSYVASMDFSWLVCQVSYVISPPQLLQRALVTDDRKWLR